VKLDLKRRKETCANVVNSREFTGTTPKKIEKVIGNEKVGLSVGGK
jgi:hypothetical protein